MVWYWAPGLLWECQVSCSFRLWSWEMREIRENFRIAHGRLPVRLLFSFSLHTATVSIRHLLQLPPPFEYKVLSRDFFPFIFLSRHWEREKEIPHIFAFYDAPFWDFIHKLKVFSFIKTFFTLTITWHAVNLLVCPIRVFPSFKCLVFSASHLPILSTTSSTSTQSHSWIWVNGKQWTLFTVFIEKLEGMEWKNFEYWHHISRFITSKTSNKLVKLIYVWNLGNFMRNTINFYLCHDNKWSRY